MRQSRHLETNLKQGDYVKLTRNVNCIPAGVYKLCDIDSDMFYFTLGQSVEFCISSNARRFISKVPTTSGILKRTSLSSFLNKYYDLLETLKPRPFSSFRPITMCAISREVAREYQ